MQENWAQLASNLSIHFAPAEASLDNLQIFPFVCCLYAVKHYDMLAPSTIILYIIATNATADQERDGYPLSVYIALSASKNET